MLILIIQSALQLIVALVSVVLQKYRYEKNKEYSEKYFNNVKVIVLRKIITEGLRWGSYCALILPLTNIIDPFYTLYIMTPIILALNLVLFDSTEWLWGLFTMVKGIYYAGIAFISICQYYIQADAGLMKCALGFTLSLGIFEAITAIASGLKSMREAKEMEPAAKK